MFLSQLSSARGEPSCDEDGVCDVKIEPKCGIPKLSRSSNDIYRYGGSAQAYKANQPEKSEICQGYEDSRHRVATWPLYVSSRRSAPRVHLTVKLWSCVPSDFLAKSSWFTSDDHDDTTCCHPLSEKDRGTTVEIWQARPGGSYSSLRPGEQDGDCRAKQTFDPSKEGVFFETVAPGSTGSLGGVGPFGWDMAPYGPPVLHMLFTGPRHSSPMLLNLPMLMERTLEARSFGWPGDWRGVTWVQRPEKVDPYNISSWKVSQEQNLVEIEVDVFLPTSDDDGKTLSEHLCRSWIYGLPSSFFLEPISECAPSMLDFFAL
jgi:hypothetical protein